MGRCAQKLLTTSGLDSHDPLQRRTLINCIPIAIFGLSGCLEANSGSVTDIFVFNETSNEVNVTIQVTRLSDDERLLDETFTLGVDATKEYEEVVSGAEVQVKIQVEDGPGNEFEWSDGEGDESSLSMEINPYYITYSSTVQ